MICFIKFSSQTNIILPFNYNLALHGIVLDLLHNKDYASFIHNTGYQYEKRNFKLYTFSRLIGFANMNKQKRIFDYGKEIGLYITAMDEQFLQNILNQYIAEKKTVNFLNNIMQIDRIEFIKEQEYPPQIIVKTLSPITTYSTLTTSEGKKKTYYYSPFEKEFSQNISQNLVKKHISYFGDEPTDSSFEINPKGKVKEVILTYKQFIIKGWSGRFEITGSKEMISTALSAGVGGKGSQGFGMIMREEDMNEYSKRSV